MLRQFSTGLPSKARASCSRVLGQASKFSLARRPMSTVEVKGIEKVWLAMFDMVVLRNSLLTGIRILQNLTESQHFPMACELLQKLFPDPLLAWVFISRADLGSKTTPSVASLTLWTVLLSSRRRSAPRTICSNRSRL
jgi:hypothetical protein